MKKILILNAHPRKGSFCDAIVNEYIRGAEESAYEINFVNVRNLRFDPVLRVNYNEVVLEDDLLEQQKLIKWCNHLVIITPVWWAGLPALFKGYLDRILTPGFAYKYHKKAILPFPKKLLKGRTARVIYTQGGPRYIADIINCGAFWGALKYGTLMFCGFNNVKRTVFGNVAGSTDKKRSKWLKKARELGKKGL